MPEPLAPNGSGAGAKTNASSTETIVAQGAATEPLRYGDFQVSQRLGAGAMGIVYQARQFINEHLTQKTVALKVLKAELSQESSFEERFFREAEHALNLHHPNIVQGILARKENGVCFMAMEFIDGETLTDLVAAKGPLPIGDALKVTLDVARGLEHAHENGVFHRDVKPGNVMVSRAGEIKVTDLGLAKAPATDFELTHHGQIVGTPVYMAPEQSDSADEPDARFDVYALGGTLFFLLTGQSPFSGSSVEEILRQKRRAPSVRAVRDDAPAEVDTLIRRMLASDPAERLQSMRDVIEAIEETGLANDRLSWVEGRADTNRPRKAETPRPKSFLQLHAVKIAALAAIVLVGLAIAVLLSRSARVEPAPLALADGFVARALERAGAGDLKTAREELQKGLEKYPDEPRLRGLATELEHGVVALFQYEKPQQKRSPILQLRAAEGIELPADSKYRVGVVLARQCHVYVFERDPRPEVFGLFPNGIYSARANPLAAGLYWFPDKDKSAWLELDSAHGVEQVFVLAVTRELRAPEQLQADLLLDPERVRSTFAHDPGSLFAPGPGAAESCFASGEWWSFFSFKHV